MIFEMTKPYSDIQGLSRDNGHARQNLIGCQRRIWQGAGSKNHLTGPLTSC
jgi:hypothetical protein